MGPPLGKHNESQRERLSFWGRQQDRERWKKDLEGQIVLQGLHSIHFVELDYYYYIHADNF